MAKSMRLIPAGFSKNNEWQKNTQMSAFFVSLKGKDDKLKNLTSQA